MVVMKLMAKPRIFVAWHPPKPKFEAGCDLPEDAVMVPFWWVGTTSNKDDANMEMYHMSVNGLQIPTLRNTQALKQFTRLLKFQEAPVPKSSSLQIAKTATCKPAKKSRKS